MSIPTPKRTSATPRFTIEQWRANTGLVDWARKIQASGEWSIFWEMLQQEHAKSYGLSPGAENPTACTRQLGRIEGYDMALALIESAAVDLEAKPLLEATFENPEEKDH